VLFNAFSLLCDFDVCFSMLFLCFVILKIPFILYFIAIILDFNAFEIGFPHYLFLCRLPRAGGEVDSLVFFKFFLDWETFFSVNLLLKSMSPALDFIFIKELSFSLIPFCSSSITLNHTSDTVQHTAQHST
jgi:hypothetical protein